MNVADEEVANLVAAGFCAYEIARELGVSTRTVKARKRRAASRLGYKGKRLDVFLVRSVYGSIPSRARLEVLAPRVQRTAELAARGMTNPEIAALMGISLHSVKNRLREIYDAAGVWNRRELARFLLVSEVSSGAEQFAGEVQGWTSGAEAQSKINKLLQR